MDSELQKLNSYEIADTLAKAAETLDFEDVIAGDEKYHSAANQLRDQLVDNIEEYDITELAGSKLAELVLFRPRDEEKIGDGRRLDLQLGEIVENYDDITADYDVEDKVAGFMLSESIMRAYNCGEIGADNLLEFEVNGENLYSELDNGVGDFSSRVIYQAEQSINQRKMAENIETMVDKYLISHVSEFTGKKYVQNADTKRLKELAEPEVRKNLEYLEQASQESLIDQERTIDMLDYFQAGLANEALDFQELELTKGLRNR